MLLHGWGLGRGVWGPLIDALADAQPQVLDLPGYGARADDGADFTATAHALLADIPAGAVLVGWSLGALLALQMALQTASTAPAMQPEPEAAAPPLAQRLRGLVLVGATPCFMQRPDWPRGQPSAVLQAFIDGVQRDGAGALRRFNALAQQGDAQARVLTRWVQQHVLDVAPASAATPTPTRDTLLRGLHWLRDVDLRPALRELSLPVCVLHGEHDSLAPLAAGQWLAQQLPQGRWVPIEGAGHAPFLGQPAHVAAALRRFAYEVAGAA